MPRGLFSSMINTESPFFKFGEARCHLHLFCNEDRYNLVHLLQKSVVRYLTWRHLRLYISLSRTSPSGSDSLAHIISKWLGVNGPRSFTSSLHFVIGLLFTRFSISQKVVNRISSVRQALSPKTATITWRTVRISLSQTPPKCEALGGLNTHWTSFCCAARITLLRSNSLMLFSSSDFAPTKFVPLSHQMFSGNDRLAANRRNAFIKESASMLCNTSRCTARVAKHVKIAR